MNRIPELLLRKAQTVEIPVIWNILQDAIEQRKQEGSAQWQNGYPNELTVHEDMEKGYAYVLTGAGQVLAYAAVIFDKEPAYAGIEGKWITGGDYVVVHRVAVSHLSKGKGIASKLFTKIEDLCLLRKVYSIRVDTNFDNAPMLKILDRQGYAYCGEVFYKGAPRKAYEKVLQGSGDIT